MGLGVSWSQGTGARQELTVARRFWSLRTGATPVPPIRVALAGSTLLWPEWAGEGQTQLAKSDMESIAPRVCVYVLK